MSMKPEERVNQEVWWVLKRIKEESLVSGEDNTFFYDTTTSLIAPGVPNRGRERKIIQNKLAQEEKTIKIIKEIEPNSVGGRNGFYLKVLQPKFDEVYRRYQKACDLQSYLNAVQEKVYENVKNNKDSQSNLPAFSHINPSKKTQDYEREIDEWLSNKELHTLRRMFQVVSAINYEWQLRDKDTFNIPLDKFGRQKITNTKDITTILSNLQDKKFLLVLKKLGETPPSPDPNKPQASLWVTIIDKPEIVNDPLAQIKLNPQRFRYLVISLKEKIAPEKTQSQNDSKQLVQNTEVQWSEKLQWGNSKEFVLGKKGSINFGTDSSNRIKVFKMLTEAKGNWVTVKDMAKAIGTSEGQLRVMMGQINNEYLQPTIIEIIERNDKNEPGAYRINIMIPLDKL